MSLITKKYIQDLFDFIGVEFLQSNFYFFYSGENSRFYRLNHSQLRQATHVNQSELSILQKNGEDENNFSVQLTGSLETDSTLIKSILDGFAVFKTGEEQMVKDGENFNEDKLLNVLFFDSLNKEVDVVGLISDGKIQRGVARGGASEFFWFETDRVDVDFSIFRDGRCVKEFYSEELISPEKFQKSINDNLQKLNILEGEKVELKPGKYQAYFSPTAVNEILSVFNWNGVQGKAIAEKQSVFMDLYEGKKAFSEKFTVRENFNLELAPRFNQEAELADEVINIIEKGKLINPLINSVTERKYGLKSNKADNHESLRSTEIIEGEFTEEQLISTLRNGIYISNLHYLNWSNKKTASITGMTRYACYFIDEKGAKHPIKDMRFNMSLFDLFGDWLVSFSKESQIFCESNTYHKRSVGGAKVPGMLSSINFSL